MSRKSAGFLLRGGRVQKKQRCSGGAGLHLEKLAHTFAEARQPSQSVLEVGRAPAQALSMKHWKAELSKIVRLAAPTR